MNEEDMKLNTSTIEEKDQRRFWSLEESKYSCQVVEERLAYLLQR
jgi:hypothetical protein